MIIYNLLMPIPALKNNLLTLPRFLKRMMVMAFDLFLCCFSVWLAFGLRLDIWNLFEVYLLKAALFAIGLSFPLFVYFGLYRAIFRYVGSAAFLSIARVFIIYTLLFFFVFSVIGIDNVPRSIGVIQPILLFLLIGMSRYFVRHWLGAFNGATKSSLRDGPVALIFGAGSSGRQLAASLLISKEMIIKGFIDDDFRLHGNTVNNIPVYPSNDLRGLIHLIGVTDILLALPAASQPRRSEIISELNGCGVRVRTLPGLLDIASSRTRASDLHDLDMNDLLGRKVVPPNIPLLERNIKNKIVLVTGAGGSIGTELCRQIVKFLPKALIMVDNSEYALYKVDQELKSLILNHSAEMNEPMDGISQPPVRLVSFLASVRDYKLMESIFLQCRPDTVFHAAAYKHVPIVESNPAEGIRNNVLGTLNCAQVSIRAGVSSFTLVSTDKAVRPTNIMGASKRIAELVLQAMADQVHKKGLPIKFSMVRFGNVLGSSGSVAPLFSAQIKAGGPITLTHKNVTRYFMTIPEAAQLVIQASAMAEGGDVFVLDMGEPVQIYDLAVKMVYLSGLLVRDETHPHGDIEIKTIGLRPGEKLYEELLIGDNPQSTAHPKIMKAHEEFLSWESLQQELESLNLALDTSDAKLTREMLIKLVPGYTPEAGI